MSINELFFKIIENPRCVKYYEDLISYYQKTSQNKKVTIYKILVDKIKNDKDMSGDKKQ